MPKLDLLSQKAFSYLFHIVLSLMLIDWAVKLPGSVGMIGIYEVVFVIFGLVSLVRLYFEKGKVFQNIIPVLKTSKWSVIALGIYLFIGFVTLFYAQTLPYALTKYIVVVQMVYFGMCMFYYISKHEDGIGTALNKIYFNIGFSAVFSAFWALVKYFFPSDSIYSAIISPINDYNQYSTIMIIGWICSTVYVVRAKVPSTRKNILLAVFSAILLPMVLVSGSRRSYLIAYVIAAIVLLLAIYIAIDVSQGKYKSTVFYKTICTLLICVLCVTLVSNVLIHTVDILSSFSQAQTNTDSDTDFSLEQEEASALDRLNKNDGLGKRSTIWSHAVDKIREFNSVEFIFGKGASYSSNIYDDFLNPKVKEILESYKYSGSDMPEKNWLNPHNIFLQDMLDGGLLLLLSQLFIIIVAVIYTLLIIRKKPIVGIALGLMYGVLLGTFILSSASGMLSNKFFWVIIMLQISEFYCIKNCKQSSEKFIDNSNGRDLLC